MPGPSAERLPIGIVAWPWDRAIALRLLGDARSLGVPAVLVPPSETAEECASSLAGTGGVILLHSPSWQPPWSPAQTADLVARSASGEPVAILRAERTGADPALAGLPTLLLSGRRYKPDPVTGAPGHTFVADHFGAGREPDGSARRGFAFLSYRGTRPTMTLVNVEVVPALVEQGFGLFDYRGTEELDRTKLPTEHGRWLDRSAVLLVVAAPDWPESEWTRLELAGARARGRPVVALRPPGVADAIAALAAVDAIVDFRTAVQDGSALAAALRSVTAGANTASGRAVEPSPT